ncbi:hypothetical protein L915_19303 [Phytophthora nicotianae]|uniref:Uncharacterized protein n=1 Tax=Phytophthora nicotianae TaxID=4792 RepID=W2FT04_PHYNI|nr:hypothetical protein L915_19303 [Phytophthora nicotianae]
MMGREMCGAVRKLFALHPTDCVPSLSGCLAASDSGIFVDESRSDRQPSTKVWIDRGLERNTQGKLV